MDCFNHFCPFRQNTTSNCNRCECLVCQNRRKDPVIYNDELILLPKEEQPSFEKELLKLLGGE